MKIRFLNKSDAPNLMGLARSFWNESEMHLYSAFPHDNILRAVFNGLSVGSIVGWCIENGKDIVSCIIFQKNCNFWSGESQLNEIAWFNDKSRPAGLLNIKLIREAEKWAKKENFTYITMARIKGPDSYNKLPDLYKKMKFKPIEETYIKKL